MTLACCSGVPLAEDTTSVLATFRAAASEVKLDCNEWYDWPPLDGN